MRPTMLFLDESVLEIIQYRKEGIIAIVEENTINRKRKIDELPFFLGATQFKSSINHTSNGITFISNSI